MLLLTKIPAIKCKYYLNFLRRCSTTNIWKEDLTLELKHKIEQRWSEIINKRDANTKNQTKCYVLSMFPYPSGQLHMGHVRVYTISDSVARFQRMNGKNVIHPIGWDAFGLPAENAAIERNIPPEDWTKQNIDHMKTQLKQLGCSFDWDREISTCSPEYYRWTQDLFLKLYEKGLVYQKKALVNWDPVDKTVLADEQVDENGYAWRSGAKVEKKYLKQWFVKTRYFAKDLYDGLSDDILHDWRDILKIQKHWIGDCNGITFDLNLIGSEDEKTISIWTDKPEYFSEAKFIIVPKNHLFANYDGEVSQGGVKKLKIHAENFITNKNIPIYVDSNNFEFESEYYLGFPGLNEHDTNFAIQQNIQYKTPEILTPPEINDITQKIVDKAKNLNKGGYKTSAKLKDWLISRQRYWGTPIPIIHCKFCGPQPVPRKNLPIELPKMKEENLKNVSLSKCHDWLETSCPKCNQLALRETDTMDTFVDSSWYYLRYLDPHNTKEIFNKEIIKNYSPVELYIGGKEHAVLHLYYARFINHFLYSLGLVPTKEPFKRLLVQGMVMGRSFRVKNSGRYVKETEVKVIDLKRNKAVLKDTNDPVVIQWEKMSKSKHNGVDPNEMFKNYGVDTTRLLIMADVAPTSHRNWNSNTFPGILNWQRRLWLTIQEFLTHRNYPPKEISKNKFDEEDFYMFDSRNYYVKGATFNYCTSQQMSVALSKMQGLTNSLRKVSPQTFAKSKQFERALGCQIILLAPMAPHFASQLWEGFVSAPNRLNPDEFFWDKNVLEQKWPDIDSNYQLELVIQVNGTENGIIKFPREELEELSQEEALKLALDNKKVQMILEKRSIIDVEYIKHFGYENVINLKTTDVIKKEKIAEEIMN
nr:probable leucine--tRNA ligase, mitochondrial [Onthophagus taurus]